MSKPKHHLRGNASKNGNGQAAKLVTPSQEEVAKYGGKKEEKGSVDRKDEKRVLAEVLGGGFDKVLSNHTDAELEAMAKREGGPIGLFQKIAEEALFGESLVELKRMMKERRRSSLSSEVEDYFDDMKARAFLRNSGARFQMMSDDRLGENMDIVMNLFKLEPKIMVPGEEREANRLKREADKMQRVLQSYPQSVSEFLMRVPSEYFKLLVYHCNLSSLDGIKALMEHRDKISFNPRLPRSNRLNAELQDPIELLTCVMHESRLEEAIKTLNIKSMKEFNDLFFKTPEMPLFIGNSNMDLLKRIMELSKVNSVSGFQELFSDVDLMEKVSHIGSYNDAWQNLTAVLSAFNIKSLDALEDFLGSDFPFDQLNDLPKPLFSAYLGMCEASSTAQFSAFLKEIRGNSLSPVFAKNLSAVKDSLGLLFHETMMQLVKNDGVTEALADADPKNLRILLNVSHFKNAGELGAALTNQKTARALRNANYEGLEALFNVLTQDEWKKSQCLCNLINLMEVSDFRHIEVLQSSVKMFKAVPERMVDLVYGILSKPSAMTQNIWVLCELIRDRKLSSKKDVEGLLELMDFSRKVLTTYLASEFMSAKDRGQLLKEWTKTASSFKEGGFDYKNELHRNLEYLRLHNIAGEEVLRQRINMRSVETYEQFSHIFGNPKAKAELTTKDKFEIKCVAYEAKLLRDFAMDAAEAAQKMGRKLLIVPNLSYGYLPVSPIIDELAAKGVEFVIGAKVGSTECHDNPDYTKAELFKKSCAAIVNEQPVILVVDGTKHIFDDVGKHRSARYPDSYQGFLNHVIALNDSYGFTDIDYDEFGKTADNIASLRADYGFCAAVDGYRKAWELNAVPVQQYGFGFWNSAGLELAIRNARDDVSRSKPISASEVTGPLLIFANVGSLNEQIPEGIRDGFKELEHTPAYFDDTERIIAIDFDFDEHGVRYLNRIEAEVKREYQSYGGIRREEDLEAPEIIKSLRTE